MYVRPGLLNSVPNDYTEQSIQMKMNELAPTLLLSTLAMQSCGDAPAFSSSDLANNSLPAEVSRRDPVLVKALDGTLICVTQGRYDFQFYKTADGYGETGYDGALDIKMLKIGGAVDFSESDLYFRITPLEALAYVNYDWGKIFTSAVHQAPMGDNPIDAMELGMNLEWLATGRLAYTAPEVQDYLPPWYTEQSGAIAGVSVGVGADGRMLPELRAQAAWRMPVVICMPNNCLLKVVEENNDGRKIHFFKNAAGYGVEGARAHLVVIGGGMESPTGNIYAEISPQEVFAHFDGDVQPLLQRAALQKLHMTQSVDPENLANIFGYSYNAGNETSPTRVSKGQKQQEPVPGESIDLEAAFLTAARAEASGAMLRRWNELDDAGKQRLMNAWAVSQSMQSK